MPPRSSQQRPAAGVAAKKTVEKPQRKPRSTAGAAEAKAAATMTKQEWQQHQVGMAEQWPQPAYMATPQEEGRSAMYFRDETYELVTRWTADTQIRYRPHAKAPGSKSHLRYEVYSAAQTVAEALRLGTWPSDWCWDYERGFIKVLGPVREEPLDVSKVMDDSQLTEVDKVIHRWHKRELAKSLGLKLEDLTIGKGSGETLIMRAHRLSAQRAAREALDAARKQGRKISDDEVLTVLRKWRFARNVTRVNVLPDDQDWVFSDTLGLLRDRVGDIHLTPPTRTYPEVTHILNQWLLDRLPEEVADFAWTTLNVNCNYAAKLHRDGNNFGPSIIKAFGDFQGGHLKYFPEDDRKANKLEDLKDADAMSLDLKDNLAMFNGNCGHSVEPFTGERYSVVYFTVSCHDRAPDDCKKRLQELGMPYPAPDADPHKLLRAPGQRGGATTPTATPAFRTYSTAELLRRQPAPTTSSKATPEQRVKKPALKADKAPKGKATAKGRR